MRSRLPFGRPAIGRLHRTPAERFEIGPVLRRDGGVEALPKSHHLWTEHYDSRPFITCVAADVVVTRAAKLASPAGAGVVRDFMVGPQEAWPRALLEVDLADYPPSGPWRTRRDVRVERIGGFSIPLGHYGLDTFGHFVLDALLQVYLHRDRLASGEARLVHWPLKEAWMAPLLEACGAPAAVRRELGKGAVLLERASLTSVMAAHGVYFPAAYSRDFFAWLKAKLTDGAAPSGGRWRRLYVRRNSATRPVLGQPQLEQHLVARGFEVLDPEAQSVKRQAQAISQAEVLVSVWGSGLTLAPMLGGRRAVVELTPATVTDPWFLRQAAVHGLTYTPVMHASADGSIAPDLAAVGRVLDRIDAA